jgi:CSLREA domain-containing protein
MAAAILVIAALAVPAAAEATTFTVDSTADETDLTIGGSCLTAAGKCTLRAAIEEANAGSGGDEIAFDEAVFEGDRDDTVTLGSNLPAVIKTTRFDGGRCMTEAGAAGPCAALHGTNSGAALKIEADEVTIENLAFVDSATAVELAGADEFELRGNWFGVQLDGAELGAINATSILVGPDSSDGQIGGKEITSGNLFVAGVAGIELFGASRVRVLGNRFGFAPDGNVAFFPIARSITIASAPSAGFDAVGNVVGAHLDPVAAKTPVCDGGCNAIVGPEGRIGLDPSGEGRGPAVETTVIGNQLGIDASGTKGVVSDGIFTGKSENTTIGGLRGGDGNRINGAGIRGGGPNLAILGNQVGLNADGTAVMAPGGGIALFCQEIENPADEALVLGNKIGMDGGVGISDWGLGATIVGNFITGAEVGLSTTFSNNGHGSLIENNLIEGSGSGVMLENDFNELYGNEILESSAGGIAIFGRNNLDATGNVIGGDTPAEENVISYSGSHAIVIAGVEGSQNEVARNSGTLNEGQFIRLFTYSPQFEPVGPNGGIQPPVIAQATTTEASGVAEPDAKVRVFRKEAGDPGEIESFLGEDIANASGEWKVLFDRAVPGETFIAATQTNVEGGTSELAFARTPKSSEGSSAGQGDISGTPADLHSPQTRITNYPRKMILRRDAVLRFTSSEAGSNFQCRLDNHRFRPCVSPIRYRHLRDGRHRFEVRAVDPAGNFDATPARFVFRVDAS